jgi:hypothetical protein
MDEPNHAALPRRAHRIVSTRDIDLLACMQPRIVKMVGELAAAMLGMPGWREKDTFSHRA